LLAPHIACAHALGHADAGLTVGHRAWLQARLGETMTDADIDAALSGMGLAIRRPRPPSPPMSGVVIGAIWRTFRQLPFVDGNLVRGRLGEMSASRRASRRRRPAR
jgi:hypothetical protein